MREELVEQYWEEEENNTPSEEDRTFHFKKPEDRDDLIEAITLAHIYIRDMRF